VSNILNPRGPPRKVWVDPGGTTVALASTSNGGKDVKSDTANEDGSVSCLSTSVCVATTGNGLWVSSGS
jgi:hypothetical protein